MRCLPFSKSERKASDSTRHRLSRGFFSHNSTSSKQSHRSPTRPSPARQRQRDFGSQAVQTCSPCSPDPATVSHRDSDPHMVSLAHSTSSPRPAPELRVFSYNELRAATRNFSRSHLLGEGGFGCVYKGSLRSSSRNGANFSQEVAVKQLNSKGQQGHKEWLSEVHFLGIVEHSNLVKLVGYCAEDDDSGIQRLLVYEYMPNKSLEHHLFAKGITSVLAWEERLRIMLGAARGLAYLHEGLGDIQVIFRDFKSSNILLDEDFTPKLSDFGLAREGPEMGASHVTTVVVGTWGYAAPEYIQTGHLTAKSDVWSFGVVLLEMLSGRRSLERNKPKNEQQLLDWMKPYLKGHMKLESFVDPKLGRRYSLAQAEGVAALSLQCLHKLARMRPLMSVVVEKLKNIVQLAETDHEKVNRLSASPSILPREEQSMKDSRDSVQSKRRRVFDNVKRFTYRMDARLFMKAWAPRPVQA